VSFKVGDTVKVINVCDDDYSYYIGEVGIIKRIIRRDRWPITVTFDTLDTEVFSRTELALIRQPYRVYKKEVKSCVI